MNVALASRARFSGLPSACRSFQARAQYQEGRTARGERRGRLVQDGKIRYHPQSLRVAAKRLEQQAQDVEPVIAAIHRASMDVSLPFHTSPGDTVLVSNTFALHYRGECSVRFTKFPTEFESRSLLVLHMIDLGANE